MTWTIPTAALRTLQVAVRRGRKDGWSMAVWPSRLDVLCVSRRLWLKLSGRLSFLLTADGRARYQCPGQSGKSSSCIAIKESLISISRDQERYIGIVDMNLFDFQQGSLIAKVNTDTRSMIGKEGKGPKISKENASRIASFFAKIGNAITGAKATSGGADPEMAKALGEGAEAATKALVEKGLEPLTTEPSLSKSIDNNIKNDQIIFFLDDLDRCYPDKAVSFLATAGELFSEGIPDVRINLVIACDPEVLARHAAHIFGISMPEGLEAVSKYIHVPLSLPIAPTSGHRQTLKNIIPLRHRENTAILSLLEKTVGIVPVRELLSAIPQAFL